MLFLFICASKDTAVIKDHINISALYGLIIKSAL